MEYKSGAGYMHSQKKNNLHAARVQQKNYGNEAACDIYCLLSYANTLPLVSHHFLIATFIMVSAKPASSFFAAM